MTLSTYPISNGLPTFNLGPSFLEYAIQREMKMSDQFANWRAALSGKKLPIYESEPWVGYFAVQDRSPGVTPAKGNRWPLIPCAIFYQGDTLMAERAGKPVPVEWVWPYAATRPIPYPTYRHWHDTGRWPDQEKAA